MRPSHGSGADKTWGGAWAGRGDREGPSSDEGHLARAGQRLRPDASCRCSRWTRRPAGCLLLAAGRDDDGLRGRRRHRRGRRAAAAAGQERRGGLQSRGRAVGTRRGGCQLGLRAGTRRWLQGRVIEAVEAGAVGRQGAMRETASACGRLRDEADAQRGLGGRRRGTGGFPGEGRCKRCADDRGPK